jgi:DNA-binding protein Fis
VGHWGIGGNASKRRTNLDSPLSAERLGINRNTLHKKLKEYGLEK